MTGTLFLIPNTLGYNEGQQDGLLAKIIPDTVQSMSAQLSYFVAENAKTTRAYLKFLGQHHPLKLAMQDIQISELNVNTPAQALVLCRGTTHSTNRHHRTHRTRARYRLSHRCRHRLR